MIFIRIKKIKIAIRTKIKFSIFIKAKRMF